MDVPLDLSTGYRMRTRAIGGFMMCLLPILVPILLLLHAVLLPLLFTAVCGLWLVRPAVLHGIWRDAKFVFRLVSATRQLKTRLKRTAGRFTTPTRPPQSAR